MPTRSTSARAVSLFDGLRRLPELGAPNDLCERALAADLQEICTVSSFRRCAVLLQEGRYRAYEMALDEGELRHNGKSAPLCEIELEYVAGSEDTFHALAAELAQQLDLVVEPTSKLARAMAL